METSSESSRAARISSSPSWFLSSDLSRGNVASSLSGNAYLPAALIDESCARPSSNSASSAKSASTCLRSAALCFFVFLSIGLRRLRGLLLEVGLDAGLGGRRHGARRRRLAVVATGSLGARPS